MKPARVQGPFVGRPAPLMTDGASSAIRKHRAAGVQWLGAEGLAEDKQADQRVHGGAERALCHYPLEHYRYWAARFPEQAAQFFPSAFGENIATEGWTEDEVRIGDVFRLGRALIQVSQPRWPCWKRGQRFGLEQLPRAVIQTGRAGWLYRVLEAGEVAPEDSFERVEQAREAPSLAALWRLQAQDQPPAELLEQLVSLTTLAEPWRQRYAKLLNRLRAKV